tara:strand:- start:291 stop:494 length:204 start_codon:yes stop_codon:yes gene_type:complete
MKPSKPLPKTKAELSADISADVEGYLSSGGVITKVGIGVSGFHHPIIKRSGFAGGFKSHTLHLREVK